MSREHVGKRKEFAADEKSEEEVLFKEEQVEPETRNGIIKGAPNVNIRDDATPKGKVVATVPEGTEVTMIGTSGNYIRIHIVHEDRPTIVGYVHHDYCSEV